MPSGFKPNKPYFCNFLFNELSEYSCKPFSDGFLNCCIPLPAPTKARLNKAPSVPNFNLFFNLRNASSLPSLVSLSIIVIAKGSKDVPFVISAKVPISSSATTASPTPDPTIAPVVGPIIFCPILAKFTYRPASFAFKAFLASKAARVPSCAPFNASGPIDVNAVVILPIVLASASSSNGLISSNHCSTSLAVLVSPTKSNISAPKDTKPFGMFHRPVATPANADSKNPTSCSFFFSVFCSSGDN